MKEVVEKLIEKSMTISTMESCTGGGVCNSITNIEGASDVFKFSAITYSNDFKIKMGVNPDIISKYSVYSMETANEMSKNISLFTGSDYGIGVTGKLNRVDKRNLHGSDNTVFISIYDKKRDCYTNSIVKCSKKCRALNKELVILKIQDELLNILK